MCQWTLLDGNLLDRVGLLGLLLLGEMDIQHAVLHFCVDLVGIDIVRQQERLLELLVGEFAAEVLAVLLALLVLGLLLPSYSFSFSITLMAGAV